MALGAIQTAAIGAETSMHASDGVAKFGDIGPSFSQHPAISLLDHVSIQPVRLDVAQQSDWASTKLELARQSTFPMAAAGACRPQETCTDRDARSVRGEIDKQQQDVSSCHVDSPASSAAETDAASPWIPS